ncbi:hypothetical protein OTU49_009799, partial [Cherax quadricarinatus]
RLRWWRCAVAIVVATVVATDVARKDNPTPGMDLLHQFLNNDPGQLCNYIQCQEPLRASECPEGTTYQEKVTQMGCCGACVRNRGTELHGKFGSKIQRDDPRPSHL